MRVGLNVMPRLRGAAVVPARHGRCGCRLAVGVRGVGNRLFQAGDEGQLQRGGAARSDDCRRRIRRQHLAGMHQRDPVAALGFVHEMGRDEDGDVVLARELGEDLPEAVAGDRIHAGGRLVEDEEDVGRVDHGDRQRQPLPQPERQRIGQGIGDVGEIESRDHLGDARGDGLRRQLEQPRMQIEILRDREFRIEREALRHVADAPPHRHVAGIDGVAEQPRGAFAHRQEAGQHLHGRGLAASVRAEKPEDLALPDAEADVVDRHEAVEPPGQVIGLDRDLLMALAARRDDDTGMAAALRIGQEADEGLIERAGSGLPLQLGGRSGRQHAAGIHRDQEVELRGLFHVGGRDDHAHAGPAVAD
jgi:hypothetical protein